MTAFFARCLEAFIKALPAALVRVLFIVVVVGAAILHFVASGRISALERSQDALKVQNVHMLMAVTDLTSEVRGYREDMREENRLLRKAKLGTP